MGPDPLIVFTATFRAAGVFLMSGILFAKQRIIGVTALVVIIVAWGYTFRPKPEAQPQRYYYDLQTNALFADSVLKLPPISTPSGSTAVAAVVYSCASCATADSRSVLLLEKYSDQYIKADAASRDDGPAIPAAIENAGRLIRRPDDSQWTMAQSRSGIDLWDKALAEHCPDGKPITICSP